MISLLFALYSYFAWAIGDIFGVFVSRKLGGISGGLWSIIFRLIIFAAYIPWAIQDLANMNMTVFLLVITVGLLFVIGDIAYYLGFEKGNPTIVGVIAGAFPSVTLLVSTLIFKEPITPFQSLAALTIFAGIVLSSQDLTKLRLKKVGNKQGIYYAITTMLTWGIYFALMKPLVRQIGWFWPSYLANLSFPLVILVMSLRKNKIETPFGKKILIPLFLSVLLTGSGDMSFNLAVNGASTALVAPIAGSYPTMFAILSFLIFREKLSRLQIFGVIITIIGIVALSSFQ